VFFVENLYADVLMQMNSRAVIADAIVSRVFRLVSRAIFVCGYNELAFFSPVRIQT
jgi:hypothetical protein